MVNQSQKMGAKYLFLFCAWFIKRGPGISFNLVSGDRIPRCGCFWRHLILKSYLKCNACTCSDIERDGFKTHRHTNGRGRQTLSANKLEKVMAGWDRCAERDDKCCQEKDSLLPCCRCDRQGAPDWFKGIREKLGWGGGLTMCIKRELTWVQHFSPSAFHNSTYLCRISPERRWESARMTKTDWSLELITHFTITCMSFYSAASVLIFYQIHSRWKDAGGFEVLLYFLLRKCVFWTLQIVTYQRLCQHVFHLSDISTTSLVVWRPLVAVVSIMAAKEEVGWRSVKSVQGHIGTRLGIDGWVTQAQDFHTGVWKREARSQRWIVSTH